MNIMYTLSNELATGVDRLSVSSGHHILSSYCIVGKYTLTLCSIPVGEMCVCV